MTRLEAAIAELVAALREELVHQTVASPAPRLLSVSETADALRVGRSTVYDLMSAGRLRSVKVGRRRLIPADAIGEVADRAA